MALELRRRSSPMGVRLATKGINPNRLPNTLGIES
jgi:hypothetical protein